MKLFAKLVLGMVLLCVTPAILAQESCPAIVTSALEAVTSACEATGRNEACYGNIALQAVPQAGVSNFSFEKAGDIVDVGNIQSLTLSSLNAEADEWGVALMKIQANVPDTLPGQNVTLLLFGDVEVQNAAAIVEETATAIPAPTATPVLLDVTSNGKINVRGEPSTSGPIVGSLAANTTLTADGRNTAGDWLHVQLSEGSSGWVFSSLVSVNGDVNTLPDATRAVSDAPAPTEETPTTPVYGPMQAFYFKTGLNDSPCSEAPDSGILIQTPEGAGKIDLVINEVSVSLGSTAYIQAQPGGDMVINVVEGQATVSALGTIIVVPAGTRARIPLDANGAASGTPVGPEPYDPAEMTSLPISPLPELITVALPLTTDQIAALRPSAPREGVWQVNGETTSNNATCAAVNGTASFTVNVRSGQTHFFISYLPQDVSPFANLPNGPRIPVASTSEIQNEGVGTWIVNVISGTHIEGISTATLPAPYSCTLTFTYSMDFIGLDGTPEVQGDASALLSASTYTVSQRIVASPLGSMTDAECEATANYMEDGAFTTFLREHLDITPGKYHTGTTNIEIISVSPNRVEALVYEDGAACAAKETITPIEG